MRAWKHILLLIGILGVTGAFAPMVELKVDFKRGSVPIHFSARRLSFDFDRAYAAIERELPRPAERFLPRSVRSAHQDLRSVVEVARWAAVAYVPAALLALLGLLGLLLGRFGRVLGALAFLVGLASIGVWLALRLEIPIVLAESGLKHVSIRLLFGAHLLLLAGAAGVLAGIGALLRPDRGPLPPRPGGAARPPGLPPPPGPPPPGPPPGFPPPSMPPPAHPGPSDA